MASPPTAWTDTGEMPAVQYFTQDWSSVSPQVLRILVELAESGVRLDVFGSPSVGRGMKSTIGEPAMGRLPGQQQAGGSPAIVQPIDLPYLSAGDRESGQVKAISELVARVSTGTLDVRNLNRFLDALQLDPGIVERSLAALGLDAANMVLCGAAYHLVGGRFLSSESVIRRQGVGANDGRLIERWFAAATSIVIVALILAALIRLS